LLLETRCTLAAEHGSATASPDAFKPLARAEVLPGTVRAFPALANGLLYARNEKTLVCLDLRQ
jgi:outer membrane protein assembly factor BamB